MTMFPQPVYKFTAQSAAYTASPGDYVLGTAASAWVLTLPPVGTGGIVGVRKVDTAAYAITVKSADGSTINGVAGATGVATGTTQGSGLVFASDGSNWWQVGS